jgi:hypothetical protein
MIERSNPDWQDMFDQLAGKKQRDPGSSPG